MVKIGSVVMNVRDVPAAARFWSDALGYAPRDGKIGDDWALIAPAHGGGPNLAFDLRDRTHLDLYAADAAEQAAEVERLIGLGARRVDDWPYPEDADFVVLEDPGGNLFCVVDTSHE
jgi:catechol 2,3-dioxygenase-like lactoylglutathione lyase family enzyme